MKNSKLVLLALGLASSMAFADDFKLGYVNIDRIFAEAAPAKAVQTSIKSKFSAQEQTLKSMNTKLVSEQSQVQQIAAKQPSFDKLNAKDKVIVNQFQKDQAGFQQKYVSFQQSVQKSQEIAMSVLMSKTNSILKDISDKKGYDLVLTSNQLVYAKAKYDLTDDVIAQLNKVNSDDVLKQVADAEKQSSAMMQSAPAR